MVVGEALRAAAGDYRLLLDRAYPAKASIALVGDRYRLSAEERLILFRGVASTAASESRRAKLGIPSPGAILLVDLYNVAFSLMHYLIGKPCFISSDGLLRDAGANYGRVVHEKELGLSFGLIATALAALGPSRLEVFLDAPVSHSGEHALAFRQQLEEACIHMNVTSTERSVLALPSPDGAIAARLGALEAMPPADRAEAFVVSADSVLVDKATKVFDLALAVILASFPGAAALASVLP